MRDFSSISVDFLPQPLDGDEGGSEFDIMDIQKARKVSASRNLHPVPSPTAVALSSTVACEHELTGDCCLAQVMGLGLSRPVADGSIQDASPKGSQKKGKKRQRRRQKGEQTQT